MCNGVGDRGLEDVRPFLLESHCTKERLAGGPRISTTLKHQPYHVHLIRRQ